MKNKDYIFYYTVAAIDILVAIIGIIYGSISLAEALPRTSTAPLLITLIICSSLFLCLSITYLVFTIMNKVKTTLWTNILTLSMSLISLLSFIVLMFYFSSTFLIVFVVEFILSLLCQVFNFLIGEKAEKQSKLKRQTPTCTIQISTEYLVKKSYTPEQAEKTIQQLYSLHENEGFSEKDFLEIKAKIEENTIKND